MVLLSGIKITFHLVCAGTNVEEYRKEMGLGEIRRETERRGKTRETTKKPVMEECKLIRDEARKFLRMEIAFYFDAFKMHQSISSMSTVWRNGIRVREKMQLRGMKGTFFCKCD